MSLLFFTLSIEVYREVIERFSYLATTMLLEGCASECVRASESELKPLIQFERCEEFDNL